ncbi:hypothetical protein [Tunturibacter empetritectus]|uniref:hypothetical protein n=1 Tax=Tunturiibacter empetritectus TaxID=3069691 RepID=UPI0021A7655F|nr:hypothetical protein [Edaphobacter lichenicola]
MRYQNPRYMVENAGAADLISGGRLQLGISRGSPQQVIDAWRHFGYSPIDGEIDEDMGRHRAKEFLECCVARASLSRIPVRCFPILLDCCTLNHTPKGGAIVFGGEPSAGRTPRMAFAANSLRFLRDSEPQFHRGPEA